MSASLTAKQSSNKIVTNSTYNRHMVSIHSHNFLKLIYFHANRPRPYEIHHSRNDRILASPTRWKLKSNTRKIYSQLVTASKDMYYTTPSMEDIVNIVYVLKNLLYSYEFSLPNSLEILLLYCIWNDEC